jgi:hypothetical protein
MARRFMELTEDYGRYFVVRGRDISPHARSYLSGLLGTQRRKNIGRIGEDVEASNYQGMQQLISDSPWDEEALMDQVAGEANGLLGGHPAGVGHARLAVEYLRRIHKLPDGIGNSHFAGDFIQLP